MSAFQWFETWNPTTNNESSPLTNIKSILNLLPTQVSINVNEIETEEIKKLNKKKKNKRNKKKSSVEKNNCDSNSNSNSDLSTSSTLSSSSTSSSSLINSSTYYIDLDEDSGFTSTASVFNNEEKKFISPLSSSTSTLSLNLSLSSYSPSPSIPVSPSSQSSSDSLFDIKEENITDNDLTEKESLISSFDQFDKHHKKEIMNEIINNNIEINNSINNNNNNDDYTFDQFLLSNECQNFFITSNLWKKYKKYELENKELNNEEMNLLLNELNIIAKQYQFKVII